MNYYDIINEAKIIFITNISEPDLNTLEIELTIGKAGELEEDPILANLNIGPTRRIFYDESSEVYKVTFHEYVAYSVINESYATIEVEEFVGTNLLICTKSAFLDYVSKDTFALANYPGEFKHYVFTSEHHVINVVSTVEPDIEKIN